MRFDLVLNNLTGWGYTTGKVTLLSDGTAWRPLVHIRDISLAIIASLEAPRDLVHNQAFNVGIPNANYQIRTLAEEVAKTVPNSTVTFAEGVEADTRNYNVSFEKIHTVLSDYFSPAWDIRDGIQEIYEACRSQRLTYEVFDGPDYMTIKGLKKLLQEGKLDNQLRWREMA
jgi:nucleoside-diphosphate-sugar epimerase